MPSEDMSMRKLAAKIQTSYIRGINKSVQMFYQWIIPSNQLNLMHAINNEIIDSKINKNLSVSRDGKTTYFTHEDAYLTDIILMRKH